MLQFQNLRVISDDKVNILCALYKSKVRFSNSFQNNRFFCMVVPRPYRCMAVVVTQKIITVNTWNVDQIFVLDIGVINTHS